MVNYVDGCVGDGGSRARQQCVSSRGITRRTITRRLCATAALLCVCLVAAASAALPPHQQGVAAGAAPASGKKSYTARNDVEMRALTLYNKAVQAEREQRLADAVQLYNQVLSDMPYLCDAHLNLGNLYTVSDRVELGLQHLRQAYTLGGQQGDVAVVAGAWNNIGLALQRAAGRDPAMQAQAADAYAQSLKAIPGQPEARYNLGRLRETQGELLEAERLYQEVLAIDPLHSGAMTNMGNVRLLQNRLQEAADYYSAVQRVASQQQGDIAVANRRSGMFNLAQALKQNRQTTRAIRVLEELLAEQPDDVLHLSLLQATRTAACVWNATEDEDRLIAATFANVDAMAAQAAGGGGGSRTPGVGVGVGSREDGTAPKFQNFANLDRVGMVVEGATVFQAMQLPVSAQRIHSLAAALSSLQHKARPPPFPLSTLRLAPPPPHMPQTGKGNRLRVAYLSYDFRTHPMGYLTLGVLLRHDRSRVEVQCFHYGPGVASATAASSAQSAAGDSSSAVVPMTARIASACDSFVHAHALSPAQLAARIRDSGAHVVVDLMAHTTHARLGVVAAKPAPVVVNYLGCPCTSGGASTDHVVVDAVVAPVEERGAFSEARVYVPHTYQANFYELTVPLCADADGQCLGKHRVRYGLPSDPRIAVLANFNTLDKLRPLSFGTWMRVMRRHPASVLWLLQPRDTAVQQRLMHEAAARGVHASRIVFAPRMGRLEHLARYQVVDLFLDTHVYTAHSTAADALWGAAPLLVCPAPTFQGRVSASLLRSLRTPWLEASSFKEYEDAAVALLRRRAALLWRLRRHISSQLLRSPTFDTALVTQHLERGYRAMWEQRAAAGVGTAAVRPRASLLHVVVDPVERRTRAASPTDLLALAHGRHTVAADPAQSAAVAARLVQDMGGARVLGGVQRLEKRLDASMQTGLRLHNGGDAESAIAVYSRILAVVPDHPDATHFSGLTKHDAGDHLEAVIQVSRSIELAKSHPDYDTDKAFLPNFRNVVAGSVAELARRAEADASEYEALWASGKIQSLVGQHDKAQTAMWEAARRQNVVEYAWASVEDAVLMAQRRVPRPADARTIAIYCNEYGQTWWPHWGPHSLEAGGGGAGGSEEAVILLSRALVARGYHVEVYNDVAEADVGVAADGVVWYPNQWYDVSDPPHAFVAWRYSVSAALGHSAGSVYVWLQDLPDLSSLFTRDVTAAIDGIVLLCRFHASHLPLHAQHKAVLSTNALDPAGFVDGPNRRLTFIYASSPSRGLEQALVAWPYIYEQLGGASAGVRFEVYYGFTPGFVRHAKRTMDNYEGWRARMDTLLLQPGVVYVGLVPPAELARAYAGAGFALYPTSYPETSCVAMMKAMAMGAIPITSRHPHSALPELTALWDLGPRVPQSATQQQEGGIALLRGIAQDPQWLQRWASHVVAAAQGDAHTLARDLGAAAPSSVVAAAASSRLPSHEWVATHRATMKAWAREHLTWDAVATQWGDDVLFTRLTRNAGVTGAESGAA